MSYKKILLKLSGESLSGERGYGIEPNVLSRLSSEIKTVHDAGIEVSVVIGGGNIFRGVEASLEHGLDRITADYMGMLGTVINALALQGAIEALEVPTRVMSAITMNAICEPFITRRAVRHIEHKRIVIFACGTGNPYFTTDTAAALRAKEIGAEVILKATKVKGVYDKDPNCYDDAVFLPHISYLDALQKQLKVMDATAFSLCMEENIPIRVFDVNTEGNIFKISMGENIGTLVDADVSAD